MTAPDPGTVALVALAALLVMGALAPLETLGWWAGWYGDPVDERHVDPHSGHPDEADAPDPVAPAPGAAAPAAPAPERIAEPWVVYLSGIHAVGPVTHERREARLVARLRAALPGGRVLEVFPYSVTNRALTGQRIFARVWRWSLNAKLSGRRLAQVGGFLINIRNLWQVLVSADRRYGPFYSRGSAELIVRSLRRRGFPIDDRGGARARIVLVGYSGGAQMAAGAAPFVRERTGAEVTVVSLGGVLSADPGLLEAERVWHLVGRADRVERITSWFFPGRWRLLSWSPWHVARRRGRLHTVVIGPGDHTGDDGYLDEEAFVADGRSHLDVTVDVLAAIAEGHGERLPVAA
ncbi:MAG: hypothetical protein ACNA8N_11315 [Trueperaceae bacterium]